MICIEISFCNFFMTVPAGTHYLESEPCLICSSDSMSCMTGIADRQLFICLCYGGGVNTLIKTFFNSKMTVPAGVGNVAGENT